MTGESTPPSWWRRRRIQFSLRSVLILIIASSLGLGWWCNCGRQHSKTVGGVVENGGYFYNALPNGLLKRVGPEWTWIPLSKSWKSWLGYEYGWDVTYVDLEGSQVSDLKPIAGLPMLEELSLSETKVDDITPLANLKHLRWLDLRGTRVSDITPLDELEQLESLNLTGTRVPKDQVDALRRRLPGCEVEWAEVERPLPPPVTATVQEPPRPDVRNLANTSEPELPGGMLELTFRREETGNSDGKLEGVFVWLHPAEPALPNQLEVRSGSDLQPVTVKYTNSGIEPKRLVVFEGLPLILSNESDGIVHPFHTAAGRYGGGNDKFVEAILPGGRFECSFSRAVFPFVIGCHRPKIPDSYGMVVDNPFFAVSDREGFASIANIPPGKCRLEFYDPILEPPFQDEPIKLDGRPLEYGDGIEVEIQNQEVTRFGTITLKEALEETQ